MQARISAMILLIAAGAANAHPGGFASWTTPQRPMPGAATLAGGPPGTRCHGLGPSGSTRA